jgi:hypothetical protein
MHEVTGILWKPVACDMQHGDPAGEICLLVYVLATLDDSDMASTNGRLRVIPQIVLDVGGDIAWGIRSPRK